MLWICGAIPVLAYENLEQRESKVLADGKEVSELISGVEAYEFQFAMTKEAAEGGYGLTGPLKLIAKSQGGANLPYVVVFGIVGQAGCGEENEPIYQKSETIKSMGWTDMVKAGETVNVNIESKYIYDNLINKLGECDGSVSDIQLEIKLLTLHKSKMGGSGSAIPEHELSKIIIPISSASLNSMTKGADEKTYNEFLSGNKAHRVKDEVLIQSIEDEVLRVKGSGIDMITIHIQDISYQNSGNTVLKWYAHNIYKSEEGKCMFGYIYGEASKYTGGYSMNYLNGEREESISCEYAEKLRNR